MAPTRSTKKSESSTQPSDAAAAAVAAPDAVDVEAVEAAPEAEDVDPTLDMLSATEVRALRTLAEEVGLPESKMRAFARAVADARADLL